MAMSKTKTMLRIYTIADFEKEERFLREQHRQGYKLVKWTFPGFYHFESCEPQDVIYKLEFNDMSSKDKSEYIQMYADFGWNYMFDVVGWSYFKKRAEDAEGNEDIFSDNQSKIEHLQKVFQRRMLPIIAIFLCCVIPNVTKIFNEGTWSAAHKAFNGFWIAMFILYVVILLYCSWGFAVLKRKYSEA